MSNATKSTRPSANWVRLAGSSQRAAIMPYWPSAVDYPRRSGALLRHDCADGFVGGPVFSQLPVEGSAAIRRFRVCAWRSQSDRSRLGPLIASQPMNSICLWNELPLRPEMSHQESGR